MNKKHRRSAKSGARNISELVDGVLEPVVAKRAGMTLELLSAWPDLIGKPLGAVTRPEKILWPRRAHEDDPFEPATLVVACEGAQAIYFQHEVTTILEKVNVFFGFAAIKRIKIEQKPVLTVTKDRLGESDKKLTNEERQNIAKIIGDIEDEELREKLSRIGEGIALKQRDE